MDMSSVSGGKIWLMAGAGRMSGDKKRDGHILIIREG